MEKVVRIGDQDIKMKATASLPLRYREKHGRELFDDMSVLSRGDFKGVEALGYVAYSMAKAADDSITDDVLEWLDNFDTLAIFEAAEDIIGLWGASSESKVQAKNRLRPQTEK